MKKSLYIILVSFFIFQISTHTCADELNRETDIVLTSAESLFKLMQSKDYAKIWGFLSQKSRDTIVHDTYKAIKANSGICSEEHIYKDFAGGNKLSRAYWDAFLHNFDPKMILEQSKWEIGSINKDNAEITIIFIKAKNPATLKMYKEEGIWRVGLVESFWTRKND